MWVLGVAYLEPCGSSCRERILALDAKQKKLYIEGDIYLRNFIQDKDAEEEPCVSANSGAFAYCIYIKHVDERMQECLTGAIASAPRRHIYLDRSQPASDAIEVLGAWLMILRQPMLLYTKFSTAAASAVGLGDIRRHFHAQYRPDELALEMELAAVSVQLLMMIPVIAMPALEARVRLEARGRAARPEKTGRWHGLYPNRDFSLFLRHPSELFFFECSGSHTYFTGSPAWQYGLTGSLTVDGILLCECDHRADEPTGLKADNSIKFITDTDRVSGREGQKPIHPRLILRVRRVTVCRKVKLALFSAAQPQSAHRGHHTHRSRPPAPRFTSCAVTLPHLFGFGLHFAASLRRAHGTNPPRRSRDSRHPCPCYKPRG